MKNELQGKLQSYYLTPEEKLHWERHYVCKTAGVESPYLTPDETDGQPASTPWKAAEGLFFKRDPKRLPQLPSPATISQQFSYPPFEYYKLSVAGMAVKQRQLYWLRITEKLRAFHLSSYEKDGWVIYYTNLSLVGNKPSSANPFTTGRTPWPIALGLYYKNEFRHMFTSAPTVNSRKLWEFQQSSGSRWYTTEKTDWPSPAQGLCYREDPTVVAARIAAMPEPKTPKTRETVMWMIGKLNQENPNPDDRGLWTLYYQYHARDLPCNLTVIETPWPAARSRLFFRRPPAFSQQGGMSEVDRLRWECCERDQDAKEESIYTVTVSPWEAAPGLYYKADPVDLAKMLARVYPIQLEGEPAVTFTWNLDGQEMGFLIF